MRETPWPPRWAVRLRDKPYLWVAMGLFAIVGAVRVLTDLNDPDRVGLIATSLLSVVFAAESVMFGRDWFKRRKATDEQA